MGVTAAREGAQLVAAFERGGARVWHGPTLGEYRPVADAAVAGQLDRLASLAPHWFAASTGAGIDRLAAVAARTGRGHLLSGVLQRATTLARGAEAAEALARLRARPAWLAPDGRDTQLEEYLATRARPSERVAIQTHGAGQDRYPRLTRSGTALATIAAYTATAPDDPRPGRNLAHAAAAAELDVVTFTSPGAVTGLAQLAHTAGLGDQLHTALAGRVAVAATGPVTAQHADRHGYPVTILPSPHRNDALVRAVLQQYSPSRTR